MKKFSGIALALVCALSLGCASLGASVNDAGDKVAGVATNVGNDSAAILERAIAIDLPGLLKATGDAVANLIKGAASMASVPLTTLQGVADEAVDTVSGE